MAGPSVGVNGDDPAMVEQVRDFMSAQWREPGFTCPNPTTYPWLWLWDSCFHSLIWAALGEPDRATAELSTALRNQTDNGFVPHVAYYDGYDGHDDFWGVRGTSSITQPPIFGHSIAVLERSGIDVPRSVKDRARHGFDFLFNVRERTEAGLIAMLHPWESGCDHSPRWDDLFTADPSDPFDAARWFERKGQMVAALELVDGASVSSTDCHVGSVAFNALIAFSARELAAVTSDESLASMADELGQSVAARWEPSLRTWIDDGVTEHGSGGRATLEALLPLLIETRPDVVADVVEQVTDPSAYLGSFGLRQVHPRDPAFDPDAYWRGASWPQLNYLFDLALRRAGHVDVAVRLLYNAREGAVTSGFSEHWNADDGTGGGARPQSWSGLVACAPTPTST